MDKANNGLVFTLPQTLQKFCLRVGGQFSSTMNLRFDKSYNDRILGDWANGRSGRGIAEKNNAGRDSDIRPAR